MDKETIKSLSDSAAKKYFQELAWNKSKVEFLRDRFSIHRHFSKSVVKALGDDAYDYLSNVSPCDYSETSVLAYKVGILSRQVKTLTEKVDALSE